MNYLTITDIARELNVAASTVRLHRDKYKDYISQIDIEGTTFYARETVEVFRLIGELSKMKRPRIEIEQELIQKFSIAAASQQVEKPITPQPVEVDLSLDSIGQLAQLLNQSGALAVLQHQVAQLERTIKELESKVSVLEIKAVVQKELEETKGKGWRFWK
jgi:transposase-like protein